MSKWAGKFVIGLTGNIGTGKSVVRKMLEHLGAYGIDADTLGHRAIARGAPGYQPLVDTFGRWIVAKDGEINRTRLARIVFADPDALAYLERVTHPLVDQAIDIIIRRSTQPVIVIEAIKLMEAGLARACDSVWVTYAPPEVQVLRLMQNRKMTEPEARLRITSQPPQEQKMAVAKVVIKNIGAFEDTWKQVMTAWQKTVPGAEAPATTPQPAVPQGEMTVLRGKPRHSNEIAELINRFNRGGKMLKKDDIMAAFGEKAYLLLQVGQTFNGIIGWQVENLVASVTDMHIDPTLSVDRALPILITEMEKASRDLQCEASLVFVPASLASQEVIWRNLGYERRTPATLGVQAWSEAAQENMTPGLVLYFKQLRQDRILRPI